jgi:hypothetical protein
LESNLQGLADVLEGDMSNHKQQILDMILQWYAVLCARTER